ncbi:Transcription factor ssl1 [Paramicrosporidium saccamoebae]|uniref:General transcription and DNA repair factor IIH n=1 Tax=Paramicrosporidium saccamoebae TaxID=1246581 RepID=A0A2H9TLM0_9FUNG|nr:Transcription factor ssl1 [Paramicrosporidium saccamoebae]
MAGVEIDDEELNKDHSLVESGFAWESRYTQSWEILKEDAAGTLQPTLAVLLQRESEYLQKRRIAADSALRRGIMRHLVILIDWSAAAAAVDVTPNRGVWVINNAVRPLIKEFFDQNPLSQVSLIVLRDGLAERRSELSPNLSEHEETLDKLVLETTTEVSPPRGVVSLQNGLEVAHSILGHVPGHGTREVLYFQIGMGSHDAGNIFDLVPVMIAAKVRFNVIAIYGEVAVTRRIAKETGGTSSVAINDVHYVDLVREQLVPPVVTRDTRTTSYLVPMGFPLQLTHQKAILCACHCTAKLKGYQCPRCRAFVCQLPIDCPICRLTLISAPHLAKSYHHLFPPPSYEDCNALNVTCAGCAQPVHLEQNIDGYRPGRCRRCAQDFCASCNYIVHSSLYNCPTCLD